MEANHENALRSEKSVDDIYLDRLYYLMRFHINLKCSAELWTERALADLFRVPPCPEAWADLSLAFESLAEKVFQFQNDYSIVQWKDDYSKTWNSEHAELLIAYDGPRAGWREDVCCSGIPQGLRSMEQKSTRNDAMRCMAETSG
ncbi:MAG: hypothetical protein Q9223_004191 [Gallowayella weberi]